MFKLLIYIKKPVIIVNSYATKQALFKIGIKTKINVIYNGITLPNKLSKIDYLENNKKFIIAMFSRISHWKGQDYFIETINKLKEYENFKHMEFWIVGDAVMGSEEEKYKQKILSKIKEYNLEKHIKFFGFVENPLDYMQYIDVLVLPSIYPEPFGRVVVEAMLLKKVVIATNMGGVKEIIDNNEDGILVDMEILIKTLKNKFIELYENKKLYNKLAESAYLKAKENFTEDTMLYKINKIIKG